MIISSYFFFDEFTKNCKSFHTIKYYWEVLETETFKIGFQQLMLEHISFFSFFITKIPSEPKAISLLGIISLLLTDIISFFCTVFVLSTTKLVDPKMRKIPVSIDFNLFSFC